MKRLALVFCVCAILLCAAVFGSCVGDGDKDIGGGGDNGGSEENGDGTAPSGGNTDGEPYENDRHWQLD